MQYIVDSKNGRIRWQKKGAEEWDALGLYAPYLTLEGCRSGLQGQAGALTLGGVEGVSPPL